MFLSTAHFAQTTEVKFQENIIIGRTQIERYIQDTGAIHKFQTQSQRPNPTTNPIEQIPRYIWSDYSTTFAKKTLNQTITHIRASHFQKAANHLMMAMMMLLMMAMMVTMMVTMLVTMMVTMMTDGWVANSWAAKNQGRTKAPHSAPANNLQRSNCETSLFFFDSIAYKYFSLLFKF